MFSMQSIPVSYTHRPPRHLTSTPRRTLVKALLHPIRQFPPPLGFLVGRDRRHVLVEILTGVFKGGDEELEWGVVVDGVVGDMVTSEGGEDGGPDGCVNGFVFHCTFRFELCPGQLWVAIANHDVGCCC